MLALKREKLPASISLAKETTTFGRQTGKVDVVIDSTVEKQMISRVHAKIVRLQGDELDNYIASNPSSSLSRATPLYKLVSIGTNGVLVNRVKVQETILKEGDEITFGGTASAKVGQEVKDSRSEL